MYSKYITCVLFLTQSIVSWANTLSLHFFQSISLRSYQYSKLVEQYFIEVCLYLWGERAIYLHMKCYDYFYNNMLLKITLKITFFKIVSLRCDPRRTITVPKDLNIFKALDI